MKRVITAMVAMISVITMSVQSEITTRAAYSRILDIDNFSETFLEDLYVPTYDLRVGWKQSENSFASAFNEPVFGIGLAYQPLGKEPFRNNTFLSDIVSVYGFAKRDFFRSKIFDAGYLLEFGPAFQSAIYDPYTNPYNYAFSSKVVFHIEAGFFASVKVSERLSAGAEVSFRHHSTGRMTMPNYGLNYIQPAVSVSYKVRKDRTDMRFRQMDYNPGWHSSVFFAGGFHKCSAPFHAFNVYVEDGTEKQNHFRFWPKASLGVSLMNRWSVRAATGISLEGQYISNIDELKRADEAIYGKEASEAAGYVPFSLGAALEHEIFYGDASVFAGIGYNIYKKYGIEDEGNGRLYEKLGMKYHFGTVNGGWLSFACRFSGVGTSDYLELGIGFDLF